MVWVARMARLVPRAAGLGLAVGLVVGLTVALLAACTSAPVLRNDKAHAAANRPPVIGTGSALTSPAPGLRPGGGFDVAAENARPGSTAWTIAPSEAGPQQAIQGYADQISVLPGEPFRLFVSTTSPRFTATAYRMGYYGGAGAREVWQSPAVKGTVQTAQTFDKSTNTVECEWQPSRLSRLPGGPRVII